MADSREVQFQQDIIDYLARHDWRVGTPDRYDRQRALYPEDVIAYYREAHPDQWERFARHHPQDPETTLLDKVVRELERRGPLEVLRHGFKVPGARVQLCTFKPDHGMNQDTLERYAANRLRVVPEVSYSPHARPGEYDPRLDLVLFVNGIPTATLELKSEFKQSVERAKRQYCRDRPSIAPVTKKPEPLLTFNRGALVHFAVSQAEVAMTTRLAGRDTVFLPFNRGTEQGGAGNPPPASEDEYATSYLWERVFDRDAWLKILGRFLHLERNTVEDFDGRRHTKQTLIFPRFHQWEVVNRLVEATRAEGVGRRYLVQHSAGSGKSNSIAWAAHQLAALYDEAGGKLFDSVVVVTDRTVLDSQLQETIHQFEHASGVVEPITREEGGSKSAQLADALAEGRRIIIVTIQTFPALFDALDQHPRLAAGRYAVIADEAHSSQTGSSASKLKAILGTDRAEAEEISAEELLDAAVAARKPSERISYYAFTATPKGKTLELFGRRPRPEEPPGDANKPEPFHLYSMRQAIEEGFILDVLRNYITYATAWKLGHPDAGEAEVDARRASAKLARWVRLHEYNIGQKVEVIVEHFRSRVAHLLNGQAKAMVVTGSRREAVRYKLAMERYVKDNGYRNVHPLVAFSGSVPADEMIPQEVTETGTLMNPGLRGRDLRDAFDTDDYNVMIVANKFQTGFDQPKLCAMYVDKKLQGVDCVQTLSRLNRVFPGKETFILDFVNDAEDVREAFEPFYEVTELEAVSDPNIVYDLQHKLDQERIYEWTEVEKFAAAFFDPRAPASRLSYWCQPARERFKTRHQAAVEQIRTWRAERRRAEETGDQAGVRRAEHEIKEAGEAKDALDLFRKNLQSFVRCYEFLAHIIDFDDRELEQLCVFARHLHPLLRIEPTDEDDIDLSELQLTHYRLTKRAEHELKLGEEEGTYNVKSPTDIGTGKAHDPKKETLAEVIERLNELFGAEVGDEHKLRWVNGIADRVESHSVMHQIRSNSPDQVMHGSFPQVLTDIVMDDMSQNGSLAMQVLEDDRKRDEFARLILRVLTDRLERTARP